MHNIRVSVALGSVQQRPVELGLGQTVLPRQPRAAKLLVSWRGLLWERGADAEGGAGARAGPNTRPGAGVVLQAGGLQGALA